MINWLGKSSKFWVYKGSERPPFAIEPRGGQRSVWDFPRPPILERESKPIVVSFQGKKIVDSIVALAVLETASPPTYYIPQCDIDMSLLIKLSAKKSICEWKGNAIYWALKIKNTLSIAWSYPNPFPEFELLKDYLAFYPQHLDCYVDCKIVKTQAGEFYAGWITADLTGPFKGEPGTGHW